MTRPVGIAARTESRASRATMVAVGASVLVHLGAGWLLWRAATVPIERAGFGSPAPAMTVELFEAPEEAPVPPLRPSRTLPAVAPSTAPAAASVSALTVPTTVSTPRTSVAPAPGPASGLLTPTGLESSPDPVSAGVVVPDTPVLAALPEVLQAPDLRYPTAAYADGRSGAVDLRVFLARDGTVVGVQVLQATPPGLFDASAVQAFYQARFAPVDGSAWPTRGPGLPGQTPVVAHVDVHVDYQVPPTGEAPGAPVP